MAVNLTAFSQKWDITPKFAASVLSLKWGSAMLLFVATTPACANMANQLTQPTQPLPAQNCDVRGVPDNPLLSSKSGCNGLHFVDRPPGMKTNVVKIKQRIPLSENFAVALNVKSHRGVGG